MGRRAHFEFNSMRIEPHTRLYQIAIDEGIVEKAKTFISQILYKPCHSYIEKVINILLKFKGK